jgi:hypothetical protein
MDGAGVERADEGLDPVAAMERGFETNPIWQTPAGKAGMIKLREVAARQQQRTATTGQPDVSDAVAARAEIERLKQDPLWRQAWAAGSADHAKQLEALIRRSLGRPPADSPRANQKKPATWGLMDAAERQAWERGE